MTSDFFTFMSPFGFIFSEQSQYGHSIGTGMKMAVFFQPWEQFL